MFDHGWINVADAVYETFGSEDPYAPTGIILGGIGEGGRRIAGRGGTEIPDSTVLQERKRDGGHAVLGGPGGHHGFILEVQEPQADRVAQTACVD